MSIGANPEAERVLLASLLEYPETYYQAMAMGLRSEHFAEEDHRLLFKFIVQLGEANQPIAFETVLSEIQKLAAAERLIAVLEDLTNPLHIPRKNIEWHVAQLLEGARRRQLVVACKRWINRSCHRFPAARQGHTRAAQAAEITALGRKPRSPPSDRFSQCSESCSQHRLVSPPIYCVPKYRPGPGGCAVGCSGRTGSCCLSALPSHTGGFKDQRYQIPDRSAIGKLSTS